MLEDLLTVLKQALQSPPTRTYASKLFVPWTLGCGYFVQYEIHGERTKYRIYLKGVFHFASASASVSHVMCALRIRLVASLTHHILSLHHRSLLFSFTAALFSLAFFFFPHLADGPTLGGNKEEREEKKKKKPLLAFPSS